TTVLPAGRAPNLQLVWEDDLARAFYKALKGEAVGPFNVATDDSIAGDDVARLHGQRIRRIPAVLAAPMADILFRLRLSPAPSAGRLCDEGFNVVAIDRPGHGLSEGRRGDCSIDQILDLVEASVAYARRRFGGPVALAGSSLGGIIGWYALTREPDVEAVVC